jgi:hypothetical protein
MTSIELLRHQDGAKLTQLFRHGILTTTDAAWNALAKAGLSPLHLVERHVAGDFGDVSPENKARNSQAIAEGSRVFSAYDVAPGVRVFVITEADRSSTTTLLPSEY